MQKIEKNKFEVIIVDNYSIDQTIEIAKRFSKKINLKILFNKVKDAEISKMKGFRESNGKFFMYMDADMTLSNDSFIEQMLSPFYDSTKVAGVFVRFLVNPKHHPLTRTLSYDAWQRDPIFRFFTVSQKDIIVEKRKSYYLCILTDKKIPPQGLMIYRKSLIKNYIKDKTQLIDNDIPVALFNVGHKNFAYVPQNGIHHYLLRSLPELSRKRVRNLQRTYFPNRNVRLFKWIDWKRDWAKVGIWMIYTFSFILPIINATYKSLKYRDSCFLNEPAINIVSTSSIVYAVTQNAIRKR